MSNFGGIRPVVLEFPHHNLFKNLVMMQKLELRAYIQPKLDTLVFGQGNLA